MTTTTTFQPSATAPFQFTAILDGQQYNVICTYNIFGQRYYINIYNTLGVLVVSRPMVGSQKGYPNNLIAGYFTSTMIYNTLNNQFEVNP